jgi:hypothetical protein
MTNLVFNEPANAIQNAKSNRNKHTLCTIGEPTIFALSKLSCFTTVTTFLYFMYLPSYNSTAEKAKRGYFALFL